MSQKQVKKLKSIFRQCGFNEILISKWKEEYKKANSIRKGEIMRDLTKISQFGKELGGYNGPFQQ